MPKAKATMLMGRTVFSLAPRALAARRKKRRPGKLGRSVGIMGFYQPYDKAWNMELL